MEIGPVRVSRRRSYRMMQTLDDITVFDLKTVSLLINIYVCLISWPLSLLHLTVSACTQGRR